MLALLLSARIGAGIAVAAADALRAAGWTTPQRMRDAPRSSVVAALGRSGYRRYDERTATRLRELATLVLEKYGGDLRRLAAAAGGEVDRSAVFLREVQAVWPWVRPCLDARAVEGARRVGLPTDAAALAALVPPEELARFAAGLVRVSLTRGHEDPLAVVR